VTPRNFIPRRGAFHFVNSWVVGWGFGELGVGEGGGEQLLAVLGFSLGVVGFGRGREGVDATAEVGSGECRGGGREWDLGFVAIWLFLAP
jgi:hypothetical protein